MAALLVLGRRCVRAHHVLAADARIHKHVLARRQAKLWGEGGWQWGGGGSGEGGAQTGVLSGRRQARGPHTKDAPVEPGACPPQPRRGLDSHRPVPRSPTHPPAAPGRAPSPCAPPTAGQSAAAARCATARAARSVAPPASAAAAAPPGRRCPPLTQPLPPRPPCRPARPSRRTPRYCSRSACCPCAPPPRRCRCRCCSSPAGSSGRACVQVWARVCVKVWG